ncbi:MAG: copper chaperone PCu(A)C [Cellulomonas sp.]|nr:copper chaperone PCu(A)C [Cellulomonas sp.]
MRQQVAAAGVVAVLALAGCSQSGSGSASSPSPTGGCPLTISDAWVKAVDSGMTAAFGTLKNTTDQTVTIDSATSPAAPMLELHEVVTGTDGATTMQPKAGGFVLDPGATTTLAPGGEHVMFMGVSTPIKVGDEVTVSLHTTAGAECTMTAPARTFTGGNETYAPSMPGMDSPSQSPMGDMGSSSQSPMPGMDMPTP